MTKRTLLSGLTGLLLLMTGCQTAAPAKQAGLDNSSFMALWGTYTHCRDTQDITEVHDDMGRLTSAVFTRTQEEGFILSIPATLGRLVSTPAPRLAVDVHAMAASCSIHAGQVSLEQGRLDLARTAFASVLTFPTEQGTSTYYQQQAQRLLTEIESGVQLSQVAR